MSGYTVRFLSLAAAACLAAGLGCSDVSLQCNSADCKGFTAAVADNKLEASGVACTANPDAVNFFYKILFIIDVSGSTGPEGGSPGSDPTGGRGRAVAQVLNTYGTNPLISYAILTFDTQPNLIQPTFTRDIGVLMGDIPQVNAHKFWTNYEAALGAAAGIIEQDANSLLPKDRARTRYDIEFLSDGTPTPGDNSCQSQGQVLASEGNLLRAVKALGVMDVRMSTIYLTGPDVDVGSCDASPTSTLGAMAALGKGTYQAMDTNDIQFEIDYTSLVQPFARRNFYVVNESRVEHYGKLYADSDRDGVSDVDEVAMGTDPTVADSFKDGCHDRMRQLESANPNLCHSTCETMMTTLNNAASLVDSDADTLLDCEEASIGSSPNTADSDGDNLVDQLEIRFGTNADDPATLTDDTDLDGVLDGDEVMQGTDPLTAEPDRSLAFKYAALTSVPSAVQGMSCFQYDVSNIQLVQTAATPTSKAGDNSICLYVEQLPVNTSSSSSQPTLTKQCYIANYVVDGNNVTIKSPASGQIALDPNNFTPTICASAPCATAQ